MLELRWLVKTRLDGGTYKTTKTLQQRTQPFGCDASGAICICGDWSEWSDVPEITWEAAAAAAESE